MDAVATETIIPDIVGRIMRDFDAETTTALFLHQC
jgi:hypothetical protein